MDTNLAKTELKYTLDWMRDGLKYSIDRVHKTHAYKAILALDGDWPIAPSTVQFPWGYMPLGDTLGNVTNQSLASMIVVSPDDAIAASKLPAKSLVYSNALKILVSGGSGIDFNIANNLHYLTGVDTPGYQGKFADIANTAYQDWFGKQILNLVNSTGTDGAYIDDVCVTVLGTTIPDYNQALIENSMLALIKVVGQQFKNAGKYLLLNTNGYLPGVSDGSSDNGIRDLAWWKQLAPYVSGIMTECVFQRRDGSPFPIRLRGESWTCYWDEWFSAIKSFHTAFPNVDFVGLAYGDDATLTYCRASLMLANSSAYFLGHRLDDSDPYGVWTKSGNPQVDPIAGNAYIT